jgi:superfamily II DNA or RNA helicase/HKD family nuclease/diadenosine tetraphosphate (Ap4A) HIT family hydrolase
MPQSCPLCTWNTAELVWKGDKVHALSDRFPVTEGHVLIAPIRHVARLGDLSAEESTELFGCIEEVWSLVRKDATDRNIGMNDGAFAGQTIQHVHLHLMPRREGDHPMPDGGVRAIIPPRKDWRRLRHYRVPSHTPFLDGREGNEMLGPLLAALDTAVEVDIASAFVTHGGIDLVEAQLLRVLERPGARVRLLTGDYLGFNEPSVFRRLAGLAPRIQTHVVETGRIGGFHAKSFIIRTIHGNSWMMVGSSNLTARALQHSIEWNVVVDEQVDPYALGAARSSFEACLTAEGTFPLTERWIASYESRRKYTGMSDAEDATPEPSTQVAFQSRTPTPIQQSALGALADDIETGSARGVVVLATGLGKTFLAASAYRRFGFKRCLFVAHREEILDQAASTFEELSPSLHVSRIGSGSSDATGQVVIASIQSLGRLDRLRGIDQTAFDLIVIDEFHHATAAQYRRVLDHFDPRYLLGLTATPRRTDRADVLGLCGGNLVYECDLFQGIAGGFLAPFDYFGIADPVDYQKENLFSRRLTAEELGGRLAFDERAELAADAWRRHIGSGRRTLAFCASLNHARFMRDYFARVAPDVPSRIIHSGSDSDPRAETLQQLRDGEVRLVFSVDILNEGVDVPQVDGVLLLRPTDSPVLFLQQLGRGLRHREGKRLKVVDFVGNHQVFLSRMLCVQGDQAEDATAVVDGLRQQAGRYEHSCGSTASYELTAIDLLEKARHLDRARRLLHDWFRTFEGTEGRRPTFRDAVRKGFYGPDGLPKARRGASWAATLHDLSEDSAGLTAPGSETRRFLDALQEARVPQPLKLLVLELFTRYAGVVRLPIEDCWEHVRRRAVHDPRIGLAVGWREDLASPENGMEQLRAVLGADEGLLEARGDGLVHLDSSLSRGVPESCAELAAEIADGRLAGYVESAIRRRAKALRDSSCVSTDDHGVEVDARWAWEWVGTTGRLILFSRGTQKRGTVKVDLNREYGEGLRLILARLAAVGGSILACFLDSADFNQLPIAERLLRIEGASYPIRLGEDHDAAALQRKIQAAQTRIGQVPGAKGGNNTRRIALMLEIPEESRDSIVTWLKTGRRRL